MARNPYQHRMMQPEQVDTGDVPYIDYNSQNINPMMMQAAAQAQQRYDLSQTAIAKAIEENASGEYRDVDYTNTVSALDRAMQDVNKTVKDKYDNQYGNALPEILKGIAKSRGILNNAQKEYKESQKYEAMMNQLEMQGKLILPGGRDPRKQASIDADGKYTPVDYSGFKEQSDYDGIIQKAVVDGIDKNVIDSGLVSANVAGMLKSVKTQGLAALGKTPEAIDKALEQAAAEYAPIFENETTYNDDVNLQNKTGGMSSKDYVKSAIYRLAKNVSDNQYVGDPGYDKDASTKTSPRQIVSGGVPALQSAGIKDTESFAEAVNYRKGFWRLQPSGGGRLWNGVEQNSIDTNIEDLNLERSYYQIEKSIQEGYRQGMSQEGLEALRTKARNKREELIKRNIVPLEANSYDKGIQQTSEDIDRYGSVKSAMAVTKTNYKEELAQMKGYSSYEAMVTESKDETKEGKERRAKDKAEVDNQMPSTEQGWIKLMDEKRDLTKNRIGSMFPITDPDASEGIKGVLSSNPTSISFYTDSEGASTSMSEAGKYVYGNSSEATRKLEAYLQKVTKDSDKYVNIDKSTGLYAIDVPTDVTLTSKGDLQIDNNTGYKTIKMALPTSQRRISDGLRIANNLTRDLSVENLKGKQNMEFTVGNNRVKFMFNNALLTDPDNTRAFLYEGIDHPISLNELQTLAFVDHLKVIDREHPVRKRK